MDYKELIERLRRYDGLLPITKDAATAIETLLAEREAAVEELREVADCTTCKFDGNFCNECDKCGDFLEGWQWRGPTPPDRRQTERL